MGEVWQGSMFTDALQLGPAWRARVDVILHAHSWAGRLTLSLDLGWELRD